MPAPIRFRINPAFDIVGMLTQPLPKTIAFGGVATGNINANYIRAKLKDTFHLPFTGASLHECVFNDKGQGITTMDFAKELIDYGFHPPTVYFPLIVKGALMIEPTETESKETLDMFIEAMKSISKKGHEDPESFHEAPRLPKVSRPDEAQAARLPKLKWTRQPV